MSALQKPKSIFPKMQGHRLQLDYGSVLSERDKTEVSGRQWREERPIWKYNK
ncbi:hypothetical protein [Brevibacillus sp. NRS-1366]|uniref:hypothetical protein n=1 Tax=Brevibacillus sp. NRS-1366 TaxID=3233899 RepID=UPI003D1D77BB